MATTAALSMVLTALPAGAAPPAGPSGPAGGAGSGAIANPIQGPTAGGGASANPIKGPASGPGKKSVRPLCATEVPRDHARCFGLVTEVDGAVPFSGSPTGLSPADIQDAYKLPAGGGAGAVIAIVDAYDNPNAAADLAVYRQTFGLPPLADGQFVKVDQRGGTNYPAPNAGWAGEIALDLDAVTAVAPNAKIILVEADSASFVDLGTAVNMAVQLGAKYVSNSYGTSYTSAPGSGEDSSLLPYEQQYYDHPGVAVVASSGDDDYGVSFPADSPHVTSVGGTSLVRDSSAARGWTESVWHNSYGGPGSGCSIVFPKPAFQTDSGCGMRSVADVSAVADPVTGLSVYNTYQADGWAQYGGTSLSSPLIAATYALGGAPVPNTYPNSYPYANPSALFDVTTGSNGTCTPSYECTAGPGYDGPTGLGTPNGVTAFSSGPRGDVKGAITDSASKQPIAGAIVTVGAGDDAVTATTAADGTYDVSVPPGDYPISVAAYGYKTKTAGPVTVTVGGAVTVNVALKKQATHTVTGRVTDGSGHGYPLYAQISIAGVPGGLIFTDPYTGVYSVDLPQGSTYQLAVTSNYAGYLPGTASVKVGANDVNKDVKLKVDTTLSSIPGYEVKNTGAVQGFDGTTAPAGWSVTDKASPGWVFNDPGKRGNLTGGTGGFAIVDSDHSGAGTSEDSYLNSPTFNLAKAADPTLEFDTNFRAYSTSDGTVELSTDAGTTWSVVWDANGATTSGHVRVALGAAAKSATVAVRFHYTGSWAYWWEVDNVFVGDRSVVPVHGGIVAGVLTDANTSDGVNSATVTAASDSSVTATSAPTGDPAVGDGFYHLFSPLTGSQAFTAAKKNYGSATASVNVQANNANRLDFTLQAGQLALNPDSISKTVGWGKTATQKVKVHNTGGLPATITLGEQSGGFVMQDRGGAPLQVIKTQTFTGSAVAQTRKAAKSGAVAAAPQAQPSADAWQTVADYPTTIQDSSAVWGNGLVYSVAGYDGSNDTSNLYAYDPQAGAWTKLAAAADTREAAATAFLGGKVILSGGWGPSGDPDGKTESYDPTTDSWSTVTANPKPHSAAGRAVLNGKLYLIGGCGTSACGSTDVQVYDPAADSWSSAAAYPEPIAWQACAGLDGQIYCAGGSAGASTKHVYDYDPGSDSWSQLPDMPLDMWGSYSTAANGQLVVAGGVINDSVAITNQAYAFDPSAGTWTALPNMNAALYRGSGAVGFYAIGGNPGGFLAPPVATDQLLPGYDQSGNADVSWLSLSTDKITVAPGATAAFTVTLDASDPAIAQPGAYTAAVTAATDTPYPTASVPITFTVKPPKTWGKIAGTVTTLDKSGTSVPVPGATVELDSWAAGYTLTTDKDGGYAIWLDKRNNPITAIVAKDGFKPQTATVKIVAGTTVTKNWVLVKR